MKSRVKINTVDMVTRGAFDKNILRVAIVGNGITNRRRGIFIDQCDRVIRFNGFQTKGYEEQIGKRIDIVILIPTGDGGTQVNKELTYSTIDQAAEFWFSRPLGSCKKPYKNLLKKINYKKEYPLQHPDTILWRQIIQKVNYSSKKTMWPSTGFVGIEMAFSLFKNCQVYITGFDQFKTRHYYDNKPICGASHPLRAEKMAISTYVRLGHIIKI